MNATIIFEVSIRIRGLEIIPMEFVVKTDNNGKIRLPEDKLFIVDSIYYLQK